MAYDLELPDRYRGATAITEWVNMVNTLLIGQLVNVLIINYLNRYDVKTC